MHANHNSIAACKKSVGSWLFACCISSVGIGLLSVRPGSGRRTHLDRERKVRFESVVWWPVDKWYVSKGPTK